MKELRKDCGYLRTTKTVYHDTQENKWRYQETDSRLSSTVKKEEKKNKEGKDSDTVFHDILVSKLEHCCLDACEII